MLRIVISQHVRYSFEANEKSRLGEEGARKVKEDWGDVDEEAGRFFMAALKVTLAFPSDCSTPYSSG